MDMDAIIAEFSKCNSLHDLSTTTARLTELGAPIFSINKARMLRYKEMLKSSNNFVRIPKEQVYLPETKEPVSTTVMNMQIFKNPVVIVAEGGIIF